MRFPSLLTLVAAMAVAGCEGTNPSKAVEGSWIGPSEIPGSRIDLVLNTTASKIEGSGVRYVEAGRSRPFTVTGGLTGRALTLSFRYTGGGTATYSGRLVNESHMSGELSEGAAPPASLDFFKQ